MEKHYAAGESIVEENATAERFFIIAKGKIQIVKRFENGEQLVLGVHSDGEFFGEMALLDEGPRSATVRAVDSTTVVEIARKDFETLIYKSPVLAYSIMRELSSRLRETAALLISHLQRRNRELSQSYLDTVNIVMQAIEARDSYTRGHTERVTDLAKAIGEQLKLSEEQLFNLEIGSLLHDVGQISVPAAILQKPGPLERGRIRPGQKAPGGGEEDRRADSLPRGGGLHDPVSPRAFRRFRLPRKAPGPADPAGRADHRSSGRFRCADQRSPLS